MRKVLAQDLIQVYVRLFLIFTVAWFCMEAFAPFLPLILWSLILAISLNPLNQWLSRRLRLSEAKSAILLVILGCLLIGLPTVMLGVSLAEYIPEWVALLTDQDLIIPEPDSAIVEWPLVGPGFYDIWSRANEDLVSALRMIQPQLMTAAKVLVAAAANTILALSLFFVSLVVAGFLMAHSKSGERQGRRLLGTFANPERGEELHELVVATIRSVANGVVGVAFLQALVLGLGFLAIDVPAAGFLALVVLLLGVLQLPSSLVTFPVIFWLWWGADGGSFGSILVTIYLVAAGFADSILKPYLLGRGVETPMPVVMLGALGGMVAEGLVGLFIGAVTLSVGYKLLMSWVDYSFEHQTKLSEEKFGASVSQKEID